MNEGSVCIMDTGTWHKAGESSNNLVGQYLVYILDGLLNHILITKPLTKKK